jgi:hypothetical protein
MKTRYANWQEKMNDQAAARAEWCARHPWLRRIFRTWDACYVILSLLSLV